MSLVWNGTPGAPHGALYTTPSPAQLPRSLSPSQVTTYLDCPYRWYCGSVLQMPDPPNGGLALGRALHRTWAAGMRGRAATGQLPAEPILARLQDSMLADEIAEAELAPDEDRATLQAQGRAMLTAWMAAAADIVPATAPAGVEVELTGEIAGITVHAVADVITSDGAVVDWKTAAKRPGAISSDHELQLTTYAMLAGVSRARLVTITKTASPAAVQHSITITPAHRHYAEAIYTGVGASIRANIYLPRRASHLCSRKHCAFWRRCEREHGGTIT